MARRADGARIWSVVLSELAQVPVLVEWDAPAWRARWTDGPTQAALTHRVQELSPYRIGRPLDAAALRFSRSDSASAVALAWLRTPRPVSLEQVSNSLGDVEALCERTAYPLHRADPPDRIAAKLLAAVAQQDRWQMGALLSAAVPAVDQLLVTADAGPELTGRVVSYRWPKAGPSPELLGFTPPASAFKTDTATGVDRSLCEQCGTPLTWPAGRLGRPERYCSGRCRTAAYRARRRNVTETPVSSHTI